MTEPLWVTGLGLVTPLGVGVEATWSALVRGDRAIRPVSLFDVAGQRVGLAAEVRGLALEEGPKGAAALVSRTSIMALAAAREAMMAARLEARDASVGLVIGTTTGGLFETERLLADLDGAPLPPGLRAEMRCHPLTATGDCLNEKLGPFSRVRVLSSACSSGANALVVATAWLLSGEVDAVLAGGADSLCRLTLTGFNALGAIDPEPCRPFDRRRRGTSLGEGAGFLVLERAERAHRRRIEPVAALTGWAIGSEAHHITNPAPDGAMVTQLMVRALARAGLAPRDVDYVSAHGTGTTHNDAMEAAAIGVALGREIARVPVSSSKAQIGHTLGAAGAIEAAVAALVVARHTLVPTAGLDEPDPALELVHVPHVGREVPRVRAAVSNAFGFGGMDTVLVFSEPHSFRGGHFQTKVRSVHVVPAARKTSVVTGVAIFGPCGLLGTTSCTAAADPRLDRAVPIDPGIYLDETRSRRLDRAGRVGAVAVSHALAAAEADARSAGLIIGSAFGNIDASAAFLHRSFDRGARLASPAEFPNLVPSSPVGHISIYVGMQGPAFATADLSTSGESAFVQAVQLIEADESASVVAGAIDLASNIVDRVMAPLYADAAGRKGTARTDLAAALVVESEEKAHGRGARLLARVAQTFEWRGNATIARVALESLAPPESDRAAVFLARSGGLASEILDGTQWSTCPRVLCAPAFGDGEAVGAVALAIAVARIGSGAIHESLVLGWAPGRGYAFVFVAS